MNVLFYTPVNFRCRDIESLAKSYSAEGHSVYLLSHGGPGPLHAMFLKMGLSAKAVPVLKRPALVTFLNRCFLLWKFCRKNEIDLLFSHLEPTNFVSVLVQYFVKARVVIYRHHIDLARLQGFDTSFTYYLTYWLAKNIVAVSEEGRKYMVDYEEISAKKVSHINLGYDFSLYEPLDQKKIRMIRQRYPADVVLITAGSLAKTKRPALSLELLKKLRDAGIDATLLFAGTGPMEDSLRRMSQSIGVGDNTFFLGYTEEILEYLSVADFLVHPSISESSCVVVKESAVTGLPVIVCKGVGDFDSYLINEVNGIVVDKDYFVDEAFLHVRRFLMEPDVYKRMASNLIEEVKARFSIDTTFHQYSKYSSHA